MPSQINNHKTKLCTVIAFVSALTLIYIVGINDYSVELGNNNLPDLEIDYGQLRDKVTSLPDQPAVNFSQYAGYITVDELHQRALFYYFVEAEEDHASKPVVMWLHGGPGCSSVGLGAFHQHGPFYPTKKGLAKNPYSWNKVANMLYLDSPAGVGFSYSVNKSFYSSVNDTTTAKDSLVFLHHWFNKFPMYKNNDFFITGESYAGHYAPQLAELILHSYTEFSLKGIAIGNPLLNFEIDYNSTVEFWYTRGLISSITYELLKNECNLVTIMRQARSGKLSDICNKVNTRVAVEITGYPDLFDAGIDKCPSENQNMSAQWHEGKKRDVCVGPFTYLGRDDVQQALHARLVGLPSPMWTRCSQVIFYDPRNQDIPIAPLLGTLVKAGVRVLIYSGDQDSVIPFTATRSIVKGLTMEFGLNTIEAYRAWFKDGQVAGWTEVYGGNLTFATVRGAGHSTALSQPGRSFVLIKAYLEGKPLPYKL